MVAGVGINLMLWKNWTMPRSKPVLLDVLVENTSWPLPGICKTPDETTCHIRIDLVKIKDVIREQGKDVPAEGSTAGTEVIVKLNEATRTEMLVAVVESDEEGVEQRSTAVHTNKSKDTTIKTEAQSFARGKGHRISIQKSDNDTTVEAPSDKSEVCSSENGIIADEPSAPRVPMSRIGRNIKRKLHHDELETSQKENVENKVKKSKNKYDRGKEQDFKVFVNLSDLSDDVDFNPKVFLRRIDESEIKKRRTSVVQMTRSGRKICKNTWWDEVDEIPTFESENELADGTQDDEATSEFTDSADDDVGSDLDYFGDVDLAKVEENGETLANKRVKNYVRSDVPCALCNKTVSSKPYLQMHMKSVHKDDENVLKCSLCSDLFATEAEVNEHVYEKHENVIQKKQGRPPKGPRVSCPLCDTGFPLSLKYKMSHHIRELHPDAAHNCERCNYSCLSNEDLDLHMKRRHINIERIKCPLCDASFPLSRKYKMNKHFKKEHADVVLSCDQCRFVCLSNEELDRHVQNKHSGNTVQCPACGKEISSRLYKEHARTEHADVALKCEKCNFSCLSGEELEQHIQDRHIATIKCSVCGEGFPITKHYGLSEHIKKHHPN